MNLSLPAIEDHFCPQYASSVEAMDIDWNSELADQLEWHWEQPAASAPGRADRRRVLLGAGARLLEHPPSRREHDAAGDGSRRLRHGLRHATARSRARHDDRLAARAHHRRRVRIPDRLALRRTARRLADLGLRNHGGRRRYASSTRATTPGSRACAGWARTALRSRAGPPRARLPSTRWRRLSCTSTAR